MPEPGPPSRQGPDMSAMAAGPVPWHRLAVRDGPWDQLLLASGAGDRASFDTLARQCRTILHVRALRVVKDVDDADEVVQESLLEVWRNAARYDPARGSVVTWMGQIVRHRAIDHVRSTSARTARELRAAHGSSAVDIDDTVESVLLSDDHDTVRDALGGLTDLQLQAVTLVYYDGLTLRQAAAWAGVPLPTMKTRVRDAVARLRSLLYIGSPSNR